VLELTRGHRGSTPTLSTWREGEGKGGDDPYFFLDNSSTATLDMPVNSDHVSMNSSSMFKVFIVCNYDLIMRHVPPVSYSYVRMVFLGGHPAIY